MKKRIAIIIQKLNGGGAERTASNLSMLLSKEHEVHLIVFDGSNMAYPYAGQLHDLKTPPEDSRIGKVKILFKRIRAVKKIKKQYDIDTTISLMDGANIVNCYSKRKDKIITSIRIQMSKSRSISGLKGFVAKSIQTMIARKSNTVVALSEGVKDDLVSVYRFPEEKVAVIYNPCDGEMLAQKAKIHEDEAKGMSPISIVTMGRLTEQKGQWHLIRAFKRVLEQFSEAKLYILGEGPLEGRLKQLAQDCGIQDNVVFLGYQEAPHAYIRNATLFVFPSLYEGLGNVLIEALSCGTVCISTDCESGPREILAPGTKMQKTMNSIEVGEYGVLTSVPGTGEFSADLPLTADEDQLAEAIVFLLTNQEQFHAYKSKAHQRACDFSPKNIMCEWMKIL